MPLQWNAGVAVLFFEIFKQLELIVPAAGGFSLGLLAHTLGLGAIEDESNGNQLLLTCVLQLP